MLKLVRVSVRLILFKQSSLNFNSYPILDFGYCNNCNHNILKILFISSIISLFNYLKIEFFKSHSEQN